MYTIVTFLLVAFLCFPGFGNEPVTPAAPVYPPIVSPGDTLNAANVLCFTSETGVEVYGASKADCPDPEFYAEAERLVAAYYGIAVDGYVTAVFYAPVVWEIGDIIAMGASAGGLALVSTHPAVGATPEEILVHELRHLAVNQLAQNLHDVIDGR